MHGKDAVDASNNLHVLGKQVVHLQVRATRPTSALLFPLGGTRCPKRKLPRAMRRPNGIESQGWPILTARSCAFATNGVQVT